MPGWVELWAEPAPVESARVFRRMARWPERLNLPLPAAPTAQDRASALVVEIPDSQYEIREIDLLYARERYGGSAAARGAPTRAWRSLRPRLARRWIAMTLERLLGKAD